MGGLALAFGIIAIVMMIPGFFIPFVSIVLFFLGIAGIVLASLAMKKGNKAIAALVCSIIGTVLEVIPAVIWLLALLTGGAE